MTHFITAHTNDKARLIVSETRTSSAEIADMVASHLIAAGYIVKLTKES